MIDAVDAPHGLPYESVVPDVPDHELDPAAEPSRDRPAFGAGLKITQ